MSEPWGVPPLPEEGLDRLGEWYLLLAERWLDVAGQTDSPYYRSRHALSAVAFASRAHALSMIPGLDPALAKVATRRGSTIVRDATRIVVQAVEARPAVGGVPGSNPARRIGGASPEGNGCPVRVRASCGDKR